MIVSDKKTVYMKVSEAAKELNVSRQHIYNMIDEGLFETINISLKGKRPAYRINRDSFLAIKEYNL